MAKMTATEAKNRFGQMLELAQKEPVHILKNGRDIGVMLSSEEYQAYEAMLKSSRVRPAVDALLKRSIKRRKSLYEALAK
ncbi:MAG TPA: type II toxin-antitoxin system Phd/YefM family antitoxin [Devosiaceae bacterium]